MDPPTPPRRAPQADAAPAAGSRSPDAAQRAVLHGVVRCRAGAVTKRGVRNGPGSARQREERCSASGTRGRLFRASCCDETNLRPHETIFRVRENHLKRSVAITWLTKT